MFFSITSKSLIALKEYGRRYICVAFLLMTKSKLTSSTYLLAHNNKKISTVFLNYLDLFLDLWSF